MDTFKIEDSVCGISFPLVQLHRLQALSFLGQFLSFFFFFLGTKHHLGNIYLPNVIPLFFGKNSKFFILNFFEKENLVSYKGQNFLGKGYQIKWPLGTAWELQKNIGSANENHCWEQHNGNMVPTVTGTLKISPAQKQNKCSQVFTPTPPDIRL